jgi:hypothetical protein
MSPHSIESSLAVIAGRQYGLVTMDQALEAGLTYGQIRGRVSKGLLVPTSRKVYRIAGAPRTWEQTALAACLGAGAGAVLCGRSAARAWQLDVPPSRQIEVAGVGRRAGAASAGWIAVRRIRNLSAEEATRVGFLPATTVARTLVDLSALLASEALERVVDDALVRRLVTPPRLRSAIERTGGRGHTGIGTLRRALEPWLEDGELDSVTEAAFARVMAQAGIPPPVRQFSVTRSDGVEARLDFAWPALRLGLEVDGYRWHGGARSHALDSVRINNLAALGWEILRTTPRELRDNPGPVLAALSFRLASRPIRPGGRTSRG